MEGFVRRLYLLVCVLALAGCGGGGSSGVPPAPTPTPVPVVPQGTLYVASPNEVEAFPLNANGPEASQRSLTGFYEQTGPSGAHWTLSGIATLSDGMLVVGSTDYIFGEDVGCGLSLYVATATSQSQSSSTMECGDLTGDPAILGSVATRSDGSIDYLMTYSGEVNSTLPNGSIVTRVPPGTHSVSMAEDASGSVYLSRGSPNRVDVYRGALTFGSTPSASLPAPGSGPLAVGPDGTVYVAYATSASYVLAIGTNGAQRTIGPLANPVYALAVDRVGELYVAQNGGTKVDVVDVFAANANGAAAPLRELVTPIPANTPNGGLILSIAIAD
jgi:hypothetical protein